MWPAFVMGNSLIHEGHIKDYKKEQEALHAATQQTTPKSQPTNIYMYLDNIVPTCNTMHDSSS